MPVEVALARQDDIVHLLVALGAQYDLPTQMAVTQSRSSYHHLTLKNWVVRALKDIDKELASTDQRLANTSDAPEVLQPEPLNFHSWNSYISNLRNSLSKLKSKKGSKTSDKTRRQEISIQKTFLGEVLKTFEGKGVKTWNKLYLDIPTGDESMSDSYSSLNKDGTAAKRGYLRNGSDQVPKHLWPLYDQLFEACWIGDAERIKQLCLPGPASTATNDLGPIQITVVAATTGDQWCKLFS